MMNKLRALLFSAIALFGGCYPEIVHAQTYSLLADARFQPMSSTGVTYPGGLLYACVVGSTCPGTPQDTYSNTTGTANANPVVLDSAGRATVYLSTAACYKLVFQNSAAVTQWTQDVVCAALPGSISGSVVTLTGTQSLSNKTLDNTTVLTIKDLNLTLQDNSDATKQAKFELSGLTTATTRTYTAPDASTTLVGTDVTQTLTNKTLTAPTITSPTISAPTVTSITNSTGLASGSYTPSYGFIANMASATAYPAYYTRTGNNVTVSGWIELEPSVATTYTQVSLTLPIASNFTSTVECAGAGAASGSGIVESIAISSNSSADRCQLNFMSNTVSNHGVSYTYTYVVVP